MPLSLQAVFATAFLVVKLGVAFRLAAPLAARCSFDRGSSLIAAWTIVYAGQAAIILGLSAFGALSSLAFALASVVGFAIVLYGARHEREQRSAPAPSILRQPFAWIIALALLLMWARSLFLGDLAWDAQTYGLPRLEMWMSAHSVFIAPDTPQLNLVVNEWNADLNALAYGLVGDGVGGFSFGNLEIFCIFFVAVAWLARELGASRHWSLVLAAVFGTAPAIVGLATTTKGDLLAITAFLMALAWLVVLVRTRNPQAFVQLVLAAVLAVGSKVSVAPSALVVVGLGTLCVAVSSRGRPGGDRSIGRSIATASGLAIGVALFASRFLTNAWQYRNPFKRVPGEVAGFAFGNLSYNVELVARHLFDLGADLDRDGHAWALSAGLSPATWFVVIVCVIAAVSIVHGRRRVAKGSDAVRSDADGRDAVRTTRAPTGRQCAFAAGAITVATVLTMAVAPSAPWSFRYFAPGIVALLILLASIAMARRVGRLQRGLLTIAAIGAVFANGTSSARPGEVLPTADPVALVSDIEKADTPLKRVSIAFAQLPDLAAVETMRLDVARPLDLLVFQGVNMPLVPFFGSRAQNRLTLVPEARAVVTVANEKAWDAIVIDQQRSLRDPSLATRLVQAGYEVLVDNELFLIALPDRRLALTPLVGERDLHWTAYGPPTDVRVTVGDDGPTVASAEPVDAGFYSQAFALRPPLFFRATFEGSIEGRGDHAAHVSLYALTTVITLPSGVYPGTHQFTGFMSKPLAGPQRIAFGLGGWVLGSGTLTLKSLQVYHLDILDANRPVDRGR